MTFNARSTVRLPKRFNSIETQPRLQASRPLRIHNAEFVPAHSSALNFDYTGGILKLAANGVADFVAPVVLYQQTKIYQISVRGLRATAADAVIVSLIRVDPNGGLTFLATVNVPNAAPYQTTLSATFSEIVSAGNSYYLDLELVAFASVNNAALIYVDIHRTQPDVSFPY